MEEQIKPCLHCRAFINGSCKAKGCRYKESATCPCVGCIHFAGTEAGGFCLCEYNCKMCPYDESV